MKIKGLRLAVLAVAICCGVNASAADYFDPLFRTVKVKGDVWILRPGDTEPILAKEDFRYPYGSKVIVDAIDPKKAKKENQKNELMIVFADKYQIKVGQDSIITTEKAITNGNAKVTVGIEKGLVSTYITLPDSKTGDATEDAKLDEKRNAFVIKTPIAEATGMVERNEIRVAKDSNGVVKSKYKIESGLINLAGSQFNILRTRRKTQFEISGDAEYTRIGVVSGEVTASINRGEDTPYQGSFKQKSVIKLLRMYTNIEKKLVVAVMIIMPNGKVERYEYIENPSDILKSLLGKSDVVDGGEISGDMTEDVGGEEVIEDTTSADLGGDIVSEETTSDSTEEESTEDFFSDDDDLFSGDDWDF